MHELEDLERFRQTPAIRFEVVRFCVGAAKLDQPRELCRSEVLCVQVVQHREQELGIVASLRMGRKEQKPEVQPCESHRDDLPV
ncbi:hypothetical protein CHL79_08755 [Delftia acidovorans]|nr:hypothetical protein CHL79_08755 [Delftia acidovorans]